MESISNKDLTQDYLSTLSPKDKPWDLKKSQSKKVEHLYQDTILDRYADRIGNCGGYLGFKWAIEEKTGELSLKLNSVKFCRVRQCPICQWRRSKMWIARFLKALPVITEAHPSARYIFLTLTVKNCQLEDLRDTLTWMNKAWQKMIQRKGFPAIGFARSTEITRSEDNLAHPHFHALLMVSSTYFKGSHYLTQAKWTDLWKSCLQVEYTPIVHVKAVKNRRQRTELPSEMDFPSEQETLVKDISSAVVETFKYSVKPSDLIGKSNQADKDWLIELTCQLHKTRSIALGGVFKNYLSEKEPENLISEDSEEETDKISDICFGWREVIERYIHVKNE